MELYHKLSDAELTTLLKKGNQLAYTEIFERYSEILLRHAFRFLNNREEANDIVQDIFLALWQKRESLEFRISISSYLYVTVRNKIFDLLSHQKVVERYADSISDFMIQGHSVTDDLIREKELAAIINKEIDFLPAKMREIFLLNKREGLSYKEISKKLNINDQTAKQQVYKAVKILKQKLNPFLVVFPFL